MFCVGDKVRRKGGDLWPMLGPACDGSIVTVAEVTDDGLAFYEDEPYKSYWHSGCYDLVEPADTPHTDNDLAMALELAQLAWDSQLDVNVSRWLRQQVIDALRARGEGQR